MELDLEAALLRELEHHQAQRLREIHVLACHYHWSETDIARLPAWRRAYYLRLLGAEAAV